VVGAARFGDRSQNRSTPRARRAPPPKDAVQTLIDLTQARPVSAVLLGRIVRSA
jgi:hypothetical protein